MTYCPKQKQIKPGLSVCMILKDEEHVLARCLESLDQIYDEICIVDTGSTDGTLDVAKNYGARSEIFTACNNDQGEIEDFAIARNRVLASATYEWILQIDGDEILDCNPQQVLSAISDLLVDQIGVYVKSEGADWVSVRLFRQVPGIHYESPIHEYIVHPGPNKIDREIVIKNIPDKRGKESSANRNVRLCKKVLDHDPENSRILHYLGNEYRKRHQFTEAIQAYALALEHDRFRIGRYHSCYYLAVCHLILENWDDAIKAGILCLEIDPRYAEAPCLLGDVYSNTGEVDFALSWYETALTKTPPSDAVMSVQKWAYSEHPRKRISDILDRLRL